MGSAEHPDVFTVIVGTAGHIDHGKSTLVKRLTGIDPDRLPEEREREMTIDLGFAPLVLPNGKTVGMIDVPGHERFVKNMVAGATGIDVALLVVDANEGVMPQTREHVDIMQLLGVRRGLVALTKIDTAGPELTLLASEDLRGFLAGTFLEGAPILPVSSATGEGIEELRLEIQRACEAVGARIAAGPFRMPIQRVFSAQGFGTVVTGVPISGSVRVGDLVEILPHGLRGKVRGIQAYRAEASEARAGQSSALNVADIERRDVVRGMVAAEPGAFEGTRFVEVRLQHLSSSKRPLRHLELVRFHAGTAEILAELAILAGKEIQPGASALCQVRLREPAVVVPGDRFIMRRAAEARTIGGGVVIGTGDHRLKPGRVQVLRDLARKEAAVGDPPKVLDEVLRAAGLAGAQTARLRVRSGMGEEALARALEGLVSEGRAVALRRGALYAHAEALEAALARIRTALEKIYEVEPLRRSVPLLEIRSRSGLGEDLFEAALEGLIARGELVRTAPAEVCKAGRAVSLSDEQAKLKDRVLALYSESPLKPPSIEEAAAALGLAKRQEGEVRKIAALLAEEGVLVPVAPGMYFLGEAVATAREAVIEEFRRAAAAGEEFSASRFRDSLGTTRKFAIPLLEYFDAAGLTARRGASRVLRAPLPPAPACGGAEASGPIEGAQTAP